MATAQEQFADYARRGQETLTAAVTDWTDTLREYTRSVADTRQLPDPALAVEQAFDLAEQLLRTQRALAVSWLTAAGVTAEAAARAAKDAADRLAPEPAA